MIKNQSALELDFILTAEDFQFVDVAKLNLADQTIGKPSRYFINICKRFITNKWALFCLIVVVLFVLLAIFVPIHMQKYGINAFNPIPVSNYNEFVANLPARLLGQNPFAIKNDVSYNDLQNYLMLNEKYKGFLDLESIKANGPVFTVHYYPYKLEPLSHLYPLLGTDERGIDIWTRLWTAVGLSLLTATIVAFFGVLIGVIYGAFAGLFAGKWIDNVMMRFVDVVSGVPSLIWLLVLGIVLAALQRQGGDNVVVRSFDLKTTMIVLVSILWFGPAITTRIYVLKNKDIEYVQAAKTLGASHVRVVFKHLLPVIFGRIMVMFVNLIPTVIFYEASLVFLNLRDINDLGLSTLLNEAITTANVISLVAPIFVFSFLTIAAQIIANALNDAIDPRIINQ